ncbi:MAG TPA: hypothetical protein VET48_05945 [Steroidobacteraceae bacterium]|nr:hypothetical protein [Steroidobacteraceae bacterium]
MSLKYLLVRPGLALALVVLILLTRTNPVTLVVNPPDATLAVFFIAGLLIPTATVYVLLFATAVAADLLSFTLGVSDWCFTPAYVFLVPTYASLWFAGYVCRNINVFSWLGAAKAAVSLALATTIAYAISTYSFYFFSGRLITEQSIAAYKEGIPHYFPMYIGWAFFYVAAAFAVSFGMRALRQRQLRQH